MKIALIGYGKMGKTIEQIALGRGHQIVSIVDINNPEEIHSDKFKSADVAIEFTTPATAFNNYMQCFAAGIPVVSGTTGWLDKIGQVKDMCEKEGKTFFYASNFSIGVNIFFAINKYLAKIMNNFSAYDIKMMETHHIHKLDAPSGTAITLRKESLKTWTVKTAGLWKRLRKQPIYLSMPFVKEKFRVSTKSHTSRMSTRSASSTMRRVVPDLPWALLLPPNLLLERKVSSEWMICLNFN